LQRAHGLRKLRMLQPGREDAGLRQRWRDGEVVGFYPSLKTLVTPCPRAAGPPRGGRGAISTDRLRRTGRASSLTLTPCTGAPPAHNTRSLPERGHGP